MLGAVAVSTGTLAQDTGDDETYVTQAGEGTQSEAPDAQPSKVYFPDAITPESVARARARAAEQEQLAARQAEEAKELEQVSSGDSNGDPIDQLSDGSSSRALSQLSEAERQVLLDAIDGTDICNNPPDIEAIRELCRTRIENRSSEFAAREANTLSAEERLLGEGLEDTGRPNIELVIERLARNVGRADDFNNQAIASVALSDQAPLGTDPTDPATDPTSDLSPEAQALINALIQQLGGNGGGS